MYDFDEIIPREGTNSVKYDLAVKMIPDMDIIPLTVADMDFACAPEIVQAIKDRADKKIFGYTVMIDDTYQQAVRNWYIRRYDWDPNVDLTISHGVVDAIETTVKAVTQPGDNVVIFTPSYSPFKQAVDGADGRNLTYCPLKITEEGFGIDFGLFEDICKREETKLFIMCNPHNPTGRVWSPEELVRIGRICFENDVFVLSDEIHADLTRTGVRVTPFKKLFPDEKRIIVCTAPSKTFNLAGLQISNIFIYQDEDGFLMKWKKLNGGAMPNPLSLEAAKAAYTCGDRWLDELRAYLDENISSLIAYMTKQLPEAKCFAPQATYLVWMDLSAYCTDNEQLEKIMKNEGVLIEAGQQFVHNGDGFIRINCACTKAMLMEAAARMVRAIQKNG